MNYKESGVDTDKEEIIMKAFINQIEKTHINSDKILQPNRYFANVINLTDEIGLAVSTDGVGTKVLISQMMEKYDTIGIDCVAMVVNDIICVGAKPITFLDYIAIEEPNEHLMMELGKGLVEGANQARVSISGGETAQVPELIRRTKYSKTGYGFDIVGMGIGMVHPYETIDGSFICEGDVIIGIESSGLHSNGYTLARNILFDIGGYSVGDYIDELGKTIGEELLEPTIIYSNINFPFQSIKAMINITGDSLLNLLRVNKNDIQFVIDNLPEPYPVFKMIQEMGRVPDEDMYRTFNMGIGFCIVVSPSYVDDIQSRVSSKGLKSYRIGHVINSKGKSVIIPSKGLKGCDRKFYKERKFSDVKINNGN